LGDYYLVALVIVGVWIAPAFLAGYLASRKERSGLLFFLLAFALPIIGLAAAIVVRPPEVRPASDLVPQAVGVSPGGQAYPGQLCGRCRKPLSPAWIGNCKHCGATYSEFPPLVRDAPT
jgi:hypothetical protein